MGGTRTLVSPSTDFPAFAGVKGGLASYRYTLGDRSRSDHGRCSTEGILFESRWRQPPEQLPGPRGHFYDLGVIRSLDVMGSAGERSPVAPFWGQCTISRFHGQWRSLRVARSPLPSQGCAGGPPALKDMIPGNPVPMTPPSTIAHYRITSKLGEGGTGAVYRSHRYQAPSRRPELELPFDRV